jgi:hypothetical protein
MYPFPLPLQGNVSMPSLYPNSVKSLVEVTTRFSRKFLSKKCGTGR